MDKKRPAKAGTYEADINNHLNSNTLSKECQMQAYKYIKGKRGTRYNMILEALDGKEMTAREVGYKLGHQDLNAVKPRLTELTAKGLLEVTGTKKDHVTNRQVSIYRRTV